MHTINYIPSFLSKALPTRAVLLLSVVFRLRSFIMKGIILNRWRPDNPSFCNCGCRDTLLFIVVEDLSFVALEVFRDSVIITS